MLAAFPAKKICQSSTAISPTQPTRSHFRSMLFLLRLAARLPLRLAHALGAVLGWMVYLCSPRYRRDFRRNLATAGLSDFRLRCSAVAEAGKRVMEVPAVWLAPLDGVRAMLKALKRGEAIGLLPDQVPGIGEGEWVEFFGKPAYTMTLVGRIAEQTGARVLLCFAERLPGGRGYRFVAEPMLEPRPPESALRALNRSLERRIRRHPEQY